MCILHSPLQRSYLKRNFRLEENDLFLPIFTKELVHYTFLGPDEFTIYNILMVYSYDNIFTICRFLSTLITIISIVSETRVSSTVMLSYFFQYFEHLYIFVLI